MPDLMPESMSDRMQERMLAISFTAYSKHNKFKLSRGAVEIMWHNVGKETHLGLAHSTKTP